MSHTEKRPQVVIIGAGFGGLAAAKRLAGCKLDVTLIDKCNHHLFQPLLYQVATADLSPAEIAWPIRSIFSRADNVSVVLDEVTGIDTDSQRVLTKSNEYSYDFLIIATGAANTYFGHDEWAQRAPGLKTLNDATTLRTRILMAFERAETSTDPDEQRRLLNFVVVGGGPTGVEMAGAIAELARAALARDFRHIDPRDARVTLIEGSDRLLNALPDSLSEYAKNALESLGVEVLTGHLVKNIGERGISLDDQAIPTETVIWAAGVKVMGVGQWLDVATDRGGRVTVTEHLSLPQHPQVFVIGDAAHIPWTDSTSGATSVPGIAPAAKQQGRYVGSLIRARQKNRRIKPFRYRHAGNLATIGRHKAVADLGKIKLKGWPAWWFWGAIHIYFLIGVRSATVVLLQWFWTYLTRKKGARLINTEQGLNDSAEASDHHP